IVKQAIFYSKVRELARLVPIQTESRSSQPQSMGAIFKNRIDVGGIHMGRPLVRSLHEFVARPPGQAAGSSSPKRMFRIFGNGHHSVGGQSFLLCIGIELTILECHDTGAVGADPKYSLVVKDESAYGIRGHALFDGVVGKYAIAQPA